MAEKRFHLEGNLTDNGGGIPQRGGTPGGQRSRSAEGQGPEVTRGFHLLKRRDARQVPASVRASGCSAHTCARAYLLGKWENTAHLLCNLFFLLAIKCSVHFETGNKYRSKAVVIHTNWLVRTATRLNCGTFC